MTSNNNIRSHGAATSTTTLGIPSFNQSQTYDSTDGEGGDGVSIRNNPSYISTLTANTTDISAVDEDNSTQASNEGDCAGSQHTSSTMSSYTQNKSARFKSAMTTRARQRRMRRMKENSTSTSTTATTNSPGGIPPTSSISSTKKLDRVASAKEHVEQMKLTQIGGTSSSNVVSSPIEAGQGLEYKVRNRSPSPSPKVGPASLGTTSTRLYEKHRSRSRSHSRNNNSVGVGGGELTRQISTGSDNMPIPSVQQQSSPKRSKEVEAAMAAVINKASPKQQQQQYHQSTRPSYTNTPPDGIATRQASGGSADMPIPAVPSVATTATHTVTPLRSTKVEAAMQSVSSAGAYPKQQQQQHQQPSCTPMMMSRQGSTGSSTNRSQKSRRSKKKESSMPSQTKPEDYIPNFNGEELSPEEVRNAANFTSVQFQYSSNLSGGGATESEIEIFSDDGSNTLTSDYFSNGVEVSGINGNVIGDNDSRKSTISPPTVWEETLSNPNTLTYEKSCWQNEVWSDATTPSIFNRGNGEEIFHQKAAANIVNLLSPDRLLGAGLMAPEVGSTEEDEKDIDVDGDSPTGVIPNTPNGNEKGGKGSSKGSMLTFDGDEPGSSRGGEWKGMIQVNRALFRDDLDEDVKQSMIFQAFRQNMMIPSEQLSDLLSQIHRKGSSNIDRAFATRRKNACGALKILTAKEENRTKICWTVGVLPAIASVLSDVNVGILDDYISHEANTEARNRIVSTLLNLSVNKKNRILIVNTPGVLESMIQTILYDMGESRQGCCTVLLYLAKTSEARTMIAKSAGMLECLSKVIEVPDEQPKTRSAAAASAKSPPKTKGRKTKKHDPVSPLGQQSPGEDTLDDTIDTFGSGRNSSFFSGSKYSVSESDVSDSHTGSSEGEDGESSVDSSINPDDVEEMTISFQSNDAIDTTVDGGGENENDNNEDMYDADPNRYLHGARLSVFACLLCLVKSQENAFIIARDGIIIEALIGVSLRHTSPSHSRAMAIMAHLTRHPKNCHQLIFKYKTLLPMLQSATASSDKEARRYAFCALQNLSMDKSCRAPIAHSPKIIWSLTQRCKEKSDPSDDEARTAAVATLQNLADEPANLIQFTIVKDCIGTIIQIAREDVVKGEKTDLTSFMAKNTLVTLSHWFRKIATSGLDRMRDKNGKAVATNAIFGADGVPLQNGGVDGGVSPGGTRSQNLYNARLEPTMYNQWS